MRRFTPRLFVNMALHFGVALTVFVLAGAASLGLIAAWELRGYVETRHSSLGEEAAVILATGRRATPDRLAQHRSRNSRRRQPVRTRCGQPRYSRPPAPGSICRVCPRISRRQPGPGDGQLPPRAPGAAIDWSGWQNLCFSFDPEGHQPLGKPCHGIGSAGRRDCRHRQCRVADRPAYSHAPSTNCNVP